MTNNDKQLFQTQNILETLLEATDHFAKLIKQKEFNQSITIFNSIVEGSQAVMTTLNNVDKSFIPHSQALEKYLVMIVEELEKRNLLKISEIVQFSLRPHFVHLQQIFIEQLGNQKKDKAISIGVFHSWGNPKDFTPKPRLNALIIEAKKQNALLYFFTSKDVNFENKSIEANTFHNNHWESVTISFPDVINNVGAGNISQVERRLRREVPFTTFHVGNKYTLPKQMIKHNKFTELLVPFRVCKDEAGVYDFLGKNNRAVFKALGSNRGENIYFVYKNGNRYVFLDHKKERIMNEKDFNYFVDNIILKEKNSYIIQKYIHARTNSDEPYHFRSHVQKNGEGKWLITNIFTGIGNKKSNLSNISSEVTIKNFTTFLIDEHGEKSGEYYKNKILKLSIDIAQHLDKIYGFGLCELGLDFTIDNHGEIWMHEANNGPQTNYHEEKRAIHLIAYAKYIAKNGIMYTDSTTKHALRKGQFQAKKSSLPIARTSEKLAIGVLKRNNTNDKFNEILAKEAEQHNVSLYSFHHRDIDFDLELVKGNFFENSTWVEKISEYPEVIIDRLNMRGHENPQYIYEELDEIPFTNEYPIYTGTRFSLYESIQNKQEIANYFTPYQAVDRLYRVIQFIENYDEVRLVPNKFSSKYSIAVIESLGDKSYRIIKDGKVKEHSMLTLRHAIQDMIEKNSYIVQEFARPEFSYGAKAEIHVHLMKHAENNWSIISTNGEVKTLKDDTVTTNSVNINEVLERLFSSEQITNIKEKINEMTTKTASALEFSNSTPISELALFVIINKELEVRVLDAFPGSFKNIYDEAKYAEVSIEYAKRLGERNVEKVEL